MVNINSFSSEERPKDVIKTIFDKQAELMKSYWTKPVKEDIDTLFWSQEIRKFSKYTVEELAEAYQAMEIDWCRWEHAEEEMIDSLHFFIEKLLIANLTYNKILGYLGTDSENIRNLIKEKAEAIKDYSIESLLRLATYHANIADNRLRNKERKEEQLPTNRDLFYKETAEWFLKYLASFYSLWINEDKLRELYSRKNQVNQFRIKSNY